MSYTWNALVSVPPDPYVCGYCGHNVGPDRGFQGSCAVSGTGQVPATIYICSTCLQPTFIDAEGQQWPGVRYGADVRALPPVVATVYDEARRCMSVHAYTTAVMACRKLLMHVAVEKGAGENKSFKHYVEWLVDNHYVPPGGGGWADQIRGRGNDANHEIDLIEQHTAEQVMSFVELLLKFVYEMPARVGVPPGSGPVMRELDEVSITVAVANVTPLGPTNRRAAITGTGCAPVPGSATLTSTPAPGTTSPGTRGTFCA